jgi:transposase
MESDDEFRVYSENPKLKKNGNKEERLVTNLITRVIKSTRIR